MNFTPASGSVSGKRLIHPKESGIKPLSAPGGNEHCSGVTIVVQLSLKSISSMTGNFLGNKAFRIATSILTRCFSLILVASIVACVFTNTGCATIEIRPQTKSDTTQTLKQFILQHEKTFNPSQYDIPITIGTPNVDTMLESSLTQDIPPESLQYTAGFRVQVLTTQDIDLANSLRDSLDLLFATDWVYLVYNVPYYKVRVGNYFERSSADRTLRYLVEKGYIDAWIVPDKIVTNPPIKLHPVPIPVDTLHEE